jgi:hypothetical protein
MAIVAVRTAATIGTLVLAIVAAAVLVAKRGPDCDNFRIDTRAWSTPGATKKRDGEDSTRQRIADDLLTCGTLDGADRSIVRRLLGRAPERFDSSWWYRLGPDRRSGGWFAIDDEILVVTFDGRGTVSDLELTVP